MIRNLIEESSVKILRVDGSLVVEFNAQGGGRAFWDGKDSAGQTVGSGIYFVVAYARSGEEIGTGKVAVVRR
jgi:flagellar hook assembly protein FlgD